LVNKLKIKEIRAICDRYAADGFPVYPTGIPFTFWEQYLQLTFYLFVSILVKSFRKIKNIFY